MSHIVYGDLNVKRTTKVDRRVNQGLSREVLTTTKTITINEFAWLQVSNASTQDIVLPNATTLDNGWELVIGVDEASVASTNIKTFHAITPVLLKNVLAGRAYRISLIDNSAFEGVWLVDYLEEADKVVAFRYVDSFNATTDWSGPSGGYYTRTVTKATHSMSANPKVDVREGTDPYTKVEPDEISIASSGDITIRVTQIPDLRFAGQMLIM